MKLVLLSGAFALASAGAAMAQDHTAAGSWTGFYVGGSAGGAFNSAKKGEFVQFDKNVDGVYGDTVTTSAGANAFSPGFCGGAATSSSPATGCKGDKDGFTYAAHGGYDWQMPGSHLVFGVVGDIGKSNTSDAVSAFSTTPAYYTLQRKGDFEGSLRARFGSTFMNDRALLYVTGGAAYARIKNSFSTSNTANAFTTTGNEDAWGYKVGAGGEYRLTPHISVGVQYLFSSVDAEDYRVRAVSNGSTPATNPFLISSSTGTLFRRSESYFNTHTISATLNYRF